MNPETKLPENRVSLITPSLSDANFKSSSQTTSGISLPVLKQNKNTAGKWIGVFIVLILSVAGYSFYVGQSLAPEILVVKSLQALHNATSTVSEGEIVIDSPENYGVYSSLAELNLVQKGIYAKDDKINLEVKFTYASNFADGTNPKKQTVANLIFSDAVNPAKKVEYSTEIKTINNKGYRTINGLPAIDDPSGSKDWNSWVIEDNKATGSITAKSNSLSFEPANFDDVIGNFLNAVTLYKVKGLLKGLGDFTSLPSEIINGVPCRHVKVHTDKEKMKTFFAQLKAENKLGDVSEEKINNLTNSIESLDLEFWMAKSNSFPQKISLIAKTKTDDGQVSHTETKINLLAPEAGVVIEVPQNTVTPQEFSQYLQQKTVMADDFNLQGFNLMNAGDNAGAKPYLELAIRYNPNHFRAYNSLGLVFAGNKDYDKAKELYKTALQINPMHDKAALNLIAAIYNKGDCADALNKSQEFLSLYPQSEFLRDVHWWKADAYTCLKQNDSAIQELNVVLELKPNDSNNNIVYHDIGANYSIMGKYSEALSFTQKSFELSLKNQEFKQNKAKFAKIYFSLGLAYYNLSRWEEAKPYIEKALQYDPGLKDQPSYQNVLKNIAELK